MAENQISYQLLVNRRQNANDLACLSSRRLASYGHSVCEGRTSEVSGSFDGDGFRQTLVPALADVGKTIRCVGRTWPTSGSVIGCPATDALGGADGAAIYAILVTRLATVVPTPTAQDVVFLGPMLKNDANGGASYAAMYAIVQACITRTVEIAPLAKIFVLSDPLFNDGVNMTNALSATAMASAWGVTQGYNLTYIYIYDCMDSGDIGPDTLHPTVPGYRKLGNCIASRVEPYL